VTSSWFFLSTLNYDARSTAHIMFIDGYELQPSISSVAWYFSGTV